MPEDYRELVREQYRVSHDKTTGSFWILDTWADDVRNLPPDADIPSDSPSLKIINSRELNALLGKLKEMGWIEKMFGQTGQETPQLHKRDIKEFAVQNITKIVEFAADQGVSKTAVEAIKEIINDLGKEGEEFEVKLKNQENWKKVGPIEAKPEISPTQVEENVTIKRGPGRPRKDEKK